MIEIEQLRFSYTGTAPFLLDGISATIRDGEYISVLGDNGSGKSTLVKLILGLLQPVSGAVRVGDGRIGYVAQKPEGAGAQFPITVRELLHCHRRLLRLRDPSAVEKALAQVHMEDFSGALVGTLSGGQLQKVFIARALMGDPGLLVLDEPSTGVDVKSQREIYGFIRELNRQRGITVVSVEHNLEAAMASSTLIYHIADGRAHICTPEQYTKEFLGMR